MSSGVDESIVCRAANCLHRLKSGSLTTLPDVAGIPRRPMCSPGGRNSVKTTVDEIEEGTMRVEALRALLIDSAIGFALAITSWMALFYVWERSEFGRPERRHGPPPQMITSIHPRRGCCQQCSSWRWESPLGGYGLGQPSSRQWPG